MSGAPATLNVLPGVVDDVTVVGTLDDGRLVVRFPSGAELLVPVHVVSLRHRGNDIETARHSADALTDDRLSKLQYLVLDALAAAGPMGMTDHEHQTVNGLGQDTAGKRRLELQRKGLVRDTGDWRNTPRAGRATVWQITRAGEEVHARAKAARHLAGLTDTG